MKICYYKELRSKPRMYADDTTLTSFAGDPCVLEHKMNCDMKSVESWLIANKTHMRVNLGFFPGISSCKRQKVDMMKSQLNFVDCFTAIA